MLQNVVRGAYASSGITFRKGLFPRGGGRKQRPRRGTSSICSVWRAALRFLARELAYGEQRRLGVAIALASGPELLMLDEPVAGLNPEEAAELARVLVRVKDDRNVTMVLVEHHMRTVMGLCDRIVVLDHGTLIAEGSPAQIAANPLVIEAYLGKGAAHA